MHVLAGAVIPHPLKDILQSAITEILENKCDYWEVVESDLNYKKLKDIVWDVKPTDEETEHLRKVWRIVSRKSKNDGVDLGREFEGCPDFYHETYGSFEGFLARKMSVRPFGIATVLDGWIDEDEFSGSNRIADYIKRFDDMISVCDPNDIYVTLDCHI